MFALKNTTSKGTRGKGVEMTLRVCTVEVMQLPEIMSAKHARLFLGVMERCINVDKPCVVLDCSNVRDMDRSVIHLLLRCLEEAIKRNGDVKLTAVPDAARAILELTGVSRLFELFETNADALNSFHRPPTVAALQIATPARSYRAFENAA
jgi:anti-anti-sigma factor